MTIDGCVLWALFCLMLNIAMLMVPLSVLLDSRKRNRSKNND